MLLINNVDKDKRLRNAARLDALTAVIQGVALILRTPAPTDSTNTLLALLEEADKITDSFEDLGF